MERSKGIPTASELKNAFEILLVERDATDEDILLQFRSNFSNLDTRREALKLIGASRDSFVISHFLETGLLISTKSKDLGMTDSAHLM